MGRRMIEVKKYEFESHMELIGFDSKSGFQVTRKKFTGGYRDYYLWGRQIVGEIHSTMKFFIPKITGLIE